VSPREPITSELEDVEKTGVGEAPLPEPPPDDEEDLGKPRLESAEDSLFPEEEPEDLAELEGGGALGLFPTDETGKRLDPELEEEELGNWGSEVPVGAKTATKFLLAGAPSAGTEFSGLKSAGAGCAKLLRVDGVGASPGGILRKLEAARSRF
jgi:hypothetical protein